MNKLITILFILVIGLAGFLYFTKQQKAEIKQEAPQTEMQSLELPQDTESPPAEHPLPTVSSGQADQSKEEMPPETVEDPLPSLGESDDSIKRTLAEFISLKEFTSLFRPTMIIHRFVVTVDNLAKPKLPNKFQLTVPPPGKFIVRSGVNDQFFLDEKNYQRYDRYTRLINAMDVTQFLKHYVHYYPLIQEAYEALGYKQRYFNDRFVEVIDHLLATPPVEEPVQLIRPNVFFQFKDPELERLSAGQKILIRIGPNNALIVKTKLRQLRKALVQPSN